MKVLVANIGSTSFKYRLYSMPEEKLLARGGVERIGADNSRSYVHVGSEVTETIAPVPDHGLALSACLKQLTDPQAGCLASDSELAAVGFKAVHALNVTGVQRVDTALIDAMEAYNPVLPAHNPPYVKAMRTLCEAYPQLPLVAAFETDFHQDAPAAYRHYAVPKEWHDKYGIRRWGFHGASHRFIAQRMRELTGRNDLRLISCHLGGSSSLCASQGGKSLGASMGMSPQSGLPQNNRVGDFDVFALPALMKLSGQSLEDLLSTLANRSGLAGLSEAGNDLRDILDAAEKGNEQAQLAIDVFVASVRDYLGSFLVRLGGADAIVFTGGIGENSKLVRTRVCENLQFAGIELDPAKNETAQGEAVVSADGSRAAIWIVPTNEELVVARQTFALVSK